MSTITVPDRLPTYRAHRQRSATHRHRPPRDPFVDLLRVAAIVVIVGQHWLMPVLAYDGGTLTAGNALATSGGWAITWAGQVMPLIFFAGGAAAAISLPGRWGRRGRTTATTISWLADRLHRLVAPVLPVAVVWLPLPVLLAAVGVPSQPVQIAAELVGRLLWFLAAYLVLVVLTPLLLRARDRYRGAEVVALAVGAVGVDLLRFGWLDGAAWLGYANVLLVWGTIYQVGVHYGSGHTGAPRRCAAVAGAGLLATAVAVVVGPYPASMIGMPGEPLSNMNPPTAALLALAAAQLGTLLAARPFLMRWARRPPVIALLGWVSRRMMTIYLWHTPALVVVAGVAVVGLGLTTPAPFSADWRNTAPLWLAFLTAVLAVLVQVAVRFEASAATVATGRGIVRVTAATALAGGGLLVLTIGGFSQDMRLWPLAATLGIAVAVGLASGRSHLPAGWVRAAARARVEA